MLPRLGMTTIDPTRLTCVHGGKTVNVKEDDVEHAQSCQNEVNVYQYVGNDRALRNRFLSLPKGKEPTKGGSDDYKLIVRGMTKTSKWFCN